MWFLCVFLSLAASASGTDIEMIINAEKVIHPGDAGHIYVNLKNAGDGKEIYVRAFSSVLNMQDRERRIRLGAGEQTVLVFSYTVKDVKAGFYDLSVVYSYVESATGVYPDKSTKTFDTRISHVEDFVQRLERPTTIRLLDNKIKLNGPQNVKLTFVSDGDVRFVKYTIGYDENLMDIKYDGSLQNFGGTKEEEIMITPKSNGEFKAEIDVFFMDALGEFHNEKIPFTITTGSNTVIQNSILVLLLASVILFIAGRFVLINEKAKQKV